MPKCAYKYCKCGGEISEGQDFIMVGSRYWHKECHEEKEIKNKIVSLYTAKVDPSPIFAALNRVINTIINTNGVPAEKLLMGIEYYAKKKIPIKAPPGLYYVVKNKDVNALWDQRTKTQIDKKSFEITEDNGTEYSHNSIKVKSFEDIFKQ